MTDSYKSLCEIARAMEPDALEVLTAVARRLTKGREQYGDLAIDNDPRDWSREAQEELLDLVVYREIERIQRGRRVVAALGGTLRAARQVSLDESDEDRAELNRLSEEAQRREAKVSR